MWDETTYQRYSRHFPVIGLDGQQALFDSSILCVGAGGLAASALPYLVGAGVGQIGLVDDDVVDLTNLQRQVYFHESQVGTTKVEAAHNNLQAINSQCSIKTYAARLSEDNADAIIPGYDIVIDATDNFKARYLINRACIRYDKPLVFASVFQFDAQVSVFNYQQGPCYECLYPTPPPNNFVPNCAQGGVIGVLPGVAGMLQAMEVIKLATGNTQILSGSLLSFDLVEQRYRHLQVTKKAHCDACGEHASKTLLPTGFKQQTCTKAPEVATLDVTTLAQWQNEQQPMTLIDVREPYERQICHIGGHHMPLNDLDEYTELLNQQPQPLVVYCKSGGRSRQAATWLQQQGFDNVYNVQGGIMAWQTEIDEQLPRY